MFMPHLVVLIYVIFELTLGIAVYAYTISKIAMDFQNKDTILQLITVCLFPLYVCVNLYNFDYLRANMYALFCLVLLPTLLLQFILGAILLTIFGLCYGITTLMPSILERITRRFSFLENLKF